MSPTQLFLYVDTQFASPYAMSAFVSLLEKGLAFETATLDLAAKANHEAGFAASSLTRRVPTLVHNGFSLSESSAISEYLDEVFPGTPPVPGRAARPGASPSGSGLAAQRSHADSARASYQSRVLWRHPATPLVRGARSCRETVFRRAVTAFRRR